MENKRRKIHEELEVVQTGFANGVAEGFPLNSDEKLLMIDEAEEAYGKFLDALKCDWRNDPNSMETPRRVAKAYVNDLWSGRYTAMSPITSFPSDGYDGIVIERNIPLTSMCSHHHQTIGGVVHIGYIAGEGGQVIGLSKLNRIVELFGRRGAIQEQLTSAIHNAVDKVTEGNKGVIVTIVGTHNCVSCRGVKHAGAAMVTTKASGVFRDNKNNARKEFFDSLKINNGGHNIQKNMSEDTIQQITEYVYKNYKTYANKPLIIKEMSTHFQILIHKDGSPLILGKEIINKK